MDSMLGSCSRSQAVINCIPYARKLARSAMFKYGVDEDDVQQDMMLRAFEASFTNQSPEYMHAAIRNGRREHVRNWFRSHRSAVRGAENIDDVHVEDTTISHDPLEYDLVMQKASSFLGLKEMLFRRYVYGESAKEVGDSMGVNASTVTQKISNFSRKVRSELGYSEPERSQSYNFINDRAGREINATVSDFCRLEGIDNGSIYKVIRGDRKQYNGWRVK